MKKYWEFLEGKKTYIAAGVIAILTFAKIVGWVTVEEFGAIVGFLTSIGLVTAHMATDRLKK